MSAQYITLSDGTIMLKFSPLEDVPFYSDWLNILLARRAAFEAPSMKLHDIDPETGLPRKVIIPYDKDQEQACQINGDGTTSIFCIGCGVPTPYSQIVDIRKTARKDRGVNIRSYGKIRIGGVVQFHEDTDGLLNGSPITVRKWRRMPVSKAGFGCPACAELYMAEDARVNGENEQKKLLYRAMTAVYTKRGDFEKLAKLKQPKLFSAWLDVFNQDAMDHADQFTPAQERAL